MSKYSKDDLLNIFRQKFKDYQYNIIDYVNNKQKIEIICDKGHLFKMSVSQHLKGYKCPYCGGYKITKDDLLNELKIKHHNLYEYPNFDYINLEDKIEIFCPKHGIFKKSIKLHRNGSKCSKCTNKYSPINEEFIKKCKLIDDSLNYSQVNYVNNKTKVNIICSKHGLISKLPSNIKTHICDKCYSNSKFFDKFKKKAIIKHNNKFNYYDYIDSKTKIKIEDKETGFLFYQTPKYHLSCNYFYNKRTVNDFIIKSKEIHKNKYEYSDSIYLGNKDKIKIKCKIHGYFEQIVNNHLRGAGCPKCNRFNFKESEVLNFIKDNTNKKLIISDRAILNGKELDIYLPDLNLAFEFNGLYWHSEIYKDRNYHLNKTINCNDIGIQLIHIWEDDWNFKKEIVKSIILNKLGKSKRIFARKCEIKEITDNIEIKKFLEENHIQGFIGSKTKIGLFYNSELVSIMTFGNLRRSLGNKTKDECYELLRFCNKLNFSIIGGASKLFKYFINNYKPKEIISYSDSSRGVGNLYKNLGFSFKHDTPTNYYWIVDGVKKHRFNFRKDKLIKNGYDPTKSEYQIMLERGYYRLFDCGSKKWIYVN